ncbi:hypothetical protein Kpol_530p38 [Vanderwaltozyma polyspora DSM 70294]|uniref:ERAD-associated E3 ubiquitin-protein ligase component HRD3 n=1 Tax=Vanderwaltozyma polyspora (strain ATCC 22028 / DSM 70294 / BCRC 21397 / CBS 2163 / NBRC 10782 / NRRL Y-8283 / UCD 57-17) TaxID=436907 RepID=A7TL12_VANPO|nr:uncharacterized protein Kpol_530p38 [Vanderwaltozyma polyspora DSM 70294]EDO17068.1 hypothetical protein Kpol_530p38 [Vanderwaltozyma polyspora DSM 70294]
MLIIWLYSIFLANLIKVLAVDVDPWNNITNTIDLYSDTLQPDYFHVNNTVLDECQLHIRRSYSLEREKQEFDKFWASLDPDSLHSSFYNDLVISSDKYQNPNATYMLAQIHLYGDYGFPHNKSLGFHYLDKFNNLTDYQNATALFDMGVLYTTGLLGTTEIDIPKGLAFFEKAADSGDLRAKQALAYRYLVGMNVPKDCGKALFLYRQLAEHIFERFTPEEWSIEFPPLESYNIRVSDLDGGLLGEGLNRITSSIKRSASKRPDLFSIYYTQMNEGKVYLSFNSDESVLGSNDDDVLDKLVDSYYTALDLFKGTYNTRRTPEMARLLLESIFEEFDSSVASMDNLQAHFYGRCVDLLGHIYLTGEGLPSSDANTAETYLNRSLQVVENLSSIFTTTNKDLGLIHQYKYGNITKAVQYYKKIFNKWGSAGGPDYQLAKLSIEHPEMKLGNPLVLMQQGHMRGYLPSTYEFASMLENGINDNYNIEDTALVYKLFVESNDWLMAPRLRDTYARLLLGDTESALWGYAVAAEQGYESAQVSAAYIMYKQPNLYGKSTELLATRKRLAVTYYARAFRQLNIDAGVIAGNLYFEMGDYPRALTSYQSAALKYSPMALWNLGYMYENALGVEKDYHLAKRFYDEALTFDPNILWGVKFSLLQLQIKSWYYWLIRSEETTIAGAQSSSIVKVLPFYKQLINLFRYSGSDSLSKDKVDKVTSNTQQQSAETAFLGRFSSLFIIVTVICIQYVIRFVLAIRQGRAHVRAEQPEPAHINEE